MRRRKFMVIGAGATAGLTATAGCMGDDGTGGNGSGTLRIGVLAQESGPNAPLGIPIRRGAEFGAQWFSDETDLDIEIETRETEFSPDTGVQRAQELVQNEEVDVLLGASSSSVALAVSEFADSQGVPYFVTASQSPQITGENCRESTIRTVDYSVQIQQAIATTAAEEFGGERVATISPDYVTGQEGWELFRDRYDEEIGGAEVVSEQFVGLDQGDFHNEIQAIVDADPDVIYTFLFGGQFISLLNQADQYDFPQSRLAWGSLASTELQELGDDAPNLIGAVTYYHQYPENDLNDTFVSEWQNEYDSLPTSNAGEAFKGVHAVVEGVQAAGEIEGGAIVDEVRGMTLNSVDGETWIRPDDNQAIDEAIISGRIGPVESQNWYGFTEENVNLVPGEDVTPEPNCEF